MDIKGNTILITGGGSGIGRSLAEALHSEGNQVIITGRREPVLKETTDANPGMKAIAFDVNDPQSIAAFTTKVTTDFPALNVVINNAGIMKAENLLDPSSVAVSESIVTTNLLGPIRLISALLPHLTKQQKATVMTVSSGLAFVPMALTATYCATKAAIHSYSQSLRHQLKDTSVEVLELVPPYVQTELMAGGSQDPRAMPLNEFVAEVIEILKTGSNAKEILVKRVHPLRFAGENGNYETIFGALNEHAPVAN